MPRDYEGLTDAIPLRTKADEARQQAQNKASESYATGGCAASRMSAAGVIEQRIFSLVREIDGLRSLLNALPREMPVDAEEALWRILVAVKS